MTAPERIYLQCCVGSICPDDVTWCDHRIEDDDVEYVRVDLDAHDQLDLLNNYARSQGYDDVWDMSEFRGVDKDGPV